MEVGYSTPQLKALMWCLRSALSVLTTSMSMMSKRTWMSPSGVLPREPGRCRDLKVAALDLAALEAALAVLGCGDVDEDQGVVVAGDQIDLGSLGGSPTSIEKLEALTLDEAGGCLDCLLLKF